ncbi:hypothetical protein CW304_16865 [Bacillus sp. UFRGS-B20]|nr:hypothetical protein CW304_16865 [Bacillus sp. UFRGS-B20]
MFSSYVSFLVFSFFMSNPSSFSIVFQALCACFVFSSPRDSFSKCYHLFFIAFKSIGYHPHPFRI